MVSIRKKVQYIHIWGRCFGDFDDILAKKSFKVHTARLFCEHIKCRRVKVTYFAITYMYVHKIIIHSPWFSREFPMEETVFYLSDVEIMLDNFIDQTLKN
jgi:hypothetical protein